LEEELAKHSRNLEELVEARTAELAVSERKYRLLVDNMAEAVFTFDRKGKLIYASTQTEKMTGYSDQQLLSMDINELIAPEQMPTVMKRIQERLT
jgi:PAS domain S-box-containing protein